jgi:hypothetical protein
MQDELPITPHVFRAVSGWKRWRSWQVRSDPFSICLRLISTLLFAILCAAGAWIFWFERWHKKGAMEIDVLCRWVVAIDIFFQRLWIGEPGEHRIFLSRFYMFFFAGTHYLNNTQNSGWPCVRTITRRFRFTDRRIHTLIPKLVFGAGKTTCLKCLPECPNFWHTYNSQRVNKDGWLIIHGRLNCSLDSRSI